MTARDRRPQAGLAYVYVDGVHCAGTVERMADGRWRASTRHALLGTDFPDRASAIGAVHAAIDGEGAR
jgi:hypothetical protein